jgi:hypothetical protein
VSYSERAKKNLPQKVPGKRKADPEARIPSPKVRTWGTLSLPTGRT